MAKRFVARIEDRYWVREDGADDFTVATGQDLYAVLIAAALGEDERQRDRALGALVRLVEEELR